MEASRFLSWKPLLIFVLGQDHDFQEREGANHRGHYEAIPQEGNGVEIYLYLIYNIKVINGGKELALRTPLKHISFP